MTRSAVRILRGHLTANRGANIAKALGSYLLSRLLRRPLVFGQPFMLMVEPTNLCNLKCPLCPAGSETLSRPQGKMALKQFTRLIDGSSEHLLHLTLWNVGEPFLNDSLIEMIRYAKSKNIYVITSTNGHFLTEKGRVRELILSGLDELILSMDGASPETYNRYRRKGQFQKVVDGLRLLTEEKEDLGTKNPIVDLQFILMRHNEHETEQMVSLAQRLKVDRLTLKTVQVTSGQEADQFLPTRRELRRYLFDNGGLRMKGRPKNDCRWLWFCPVINWDGTVVPCCFDKDNRFPLGNVFQAAPLKDIWRSEKYNALRRKILAARGEIALCHNCSEGLKGLYLKRARLR
ncbi:MAG: radical SAM/SPASM domain-containing protein [bacterium]